MKLLPITLQHHRTCSSRPRRGFPFLSIKDISGGYLDFSSTRSNSEEEHGEISARCSPTKAGILFCRIGTLGRAVVVDSDRPFSIFVSVGLIRMTGDVDPHYLRVALNSLSPAPAPP